MKESIAILLLFSILVGGIVLVLIGQEAVVGNTPKIEKYPLFFNRTLRYHAIGDWGELGKDKYIENTFPVEYVAQSMAAQARARAISMIVTVGDNKYSHTKGYFDKVFFELLDKVFNLGAIKVLPWYATFGNHDCYINEDYQLNMNNLYPQWNIHKYYNLSIPLDDHNNVEMIFLNGCQLACENYTEYEYISGCHKFPSKPSKEKIDEEYEWLETHLKYLAKSPKTAWKIAHIHYPLFDAGDHSDNEALKQVLYPKLAEYKVDAVFSGHSHMMEYFVSPYNSLYYPLNYTGTDCGQSEYSNGPTTREFYQGDHLHEIVIGNGGKSLDEFCVGRQTPMAELIYANSICWGFAEIEVSPSRMQINYWASIPYNKTSPLYRDTLIFQSNIHKK